MNQRSHLRVGLNKTGVAQPPMRESLNGTENRPSFYKHQRRQSSHSAALGLCEVNVADDANRLGQVEECLKEVTERCSIEVVACLQSIVGQYRALLARPAQTPQDQTNRDRKALDEANEKLNACHLRIAELEAINDNPIHLSESSSQRNGLLEFEKQLADREIIINKRQAAMLIRQNQLKSQEIENRSETSTLHNLRQALARERQDIDKCWDKLVYEIDQEGCYSRHIKERFETSLKLQLRNNEEERKCLTRKHRRIDRLLVSLLPPA